MPLAEFAGTLGIKRAAHLLRRASFGATKSQIDYFAQLTPQQAINELFRQTLPMPLPPIDPKTGQEWMTNGTTDANSKSGDLEKYFLGWFLGQMLSNDIPESLSLSYSAREKIVFFLHSHFTAIRSKISSSRALYFQNQLLRQFALDGNDVRPEINIKDLTIKISIDNAMLKLLDGNLNVKGSVNENYARELLELYTIGRGLEGSVPTSLPTGDYYLFTEQDVVAAAQVLSGWTNDDTFSSIDTLTLLPIGKVRGTATNASAHDNTVKQFSARFGNATIQPDPLLLNGSAPTQESALDEIRQLVDLIYSKEETAKNICWKIYRFFVYAPHDVYSEGSVVKAIDNDVIKEMAALLTSPSNGFKILPVIENLLKSDHFYDSANELITDDNFGGIIRSPLDLTINTLRMFSITLPSMTSSPAAFYEHTNELLEIIRALGMDFFEPYDVAGYDAYHQFPAYHRLWITPNTLARRYEFIRTVFNVEEMNGMFKANAYEFVNANFAGVASDARSLITALAQYLLPMADNLTFDTNDETGSITSERLLYFKSRFLAEFDEGYWTSTWNAPDNEGEKRAWLEQLFNAMLQSPEYQLQ